MAGAVLARTEFVGRERELADLRLRLERARDGIGGVVAVQAEAGLGKTRLCDELRGIARANGFVTLTGHCLEGGGIPYLAFAELLEDAVASFGGADIRAAAATSGTELAWIAPTLRQAFGDAPATRPVPAELERQALFGAVRDFLDRLGRVSPLLLIVEDAHWADEATALLLRHLVRFTRTRRVLLAVTSRSGDEEGRGEAPVTGLLREVERQGTDGILELGELGLADVAAMVASLTGREPPGYIGQALYERIGGNPLFIEQVVKHLLDEGMLFDERDRWIELTSFDELPIPASVRSVIERRLARADSRQVLAAAAVAGQRADYTLLAEVTGLSREALLAAVEDAEQAHLVAVEATKDGLQVRFRHDLIRQAILEQTSLPRRQQLHLDTALAIERRCDISGGEYDQDLAQHYLQSRSAVHVDRTLHYLQAAARRAIAATAFEDAARLYAEALALAPREETAARCEMLLLLGEARKRVSDSDAARRVFEEAAAIARELGDAQLYARAALGYARSWPTVGSVDERAVAYMRGALTLVPEEDLELRARLQSRMALQMLYCGAPDEVLTQARDAVELARRSGDLIALARGLQVLHSALWQPRHLDERLLVAGEIVELADAIGDPSIALWGIRPRIADLMELTDVAGAQADVEAYERGAAAARQPIYLWQAAVRKAMLAIFRGHLDEGERLARRALELGRQAEGQNLIAAFGGQLLVIRWQQGRTEELRGLIEASRRNEPHVPLWTAVLAFIEAEAGRRAEARARFEELAADRFEAASREDTGLVVLVLASLVCAALGDGIRAEELYERLLPYDGRNIVVSEGVASVGAAALYLGMLAATARRIDDAERHLRSAIEINERTGGRPWLAHAQFELANVLLTRRRTGDRRAAAELVRTALGIARDAGMRGLQERIEQIQRSHKRLAPERPDGLTQREQEVLLLVAGGHSTREISERLVLSERTTARHITNIYAKIGARNRAEATAYAMRHLSAD
jgi:DNA-binding CsgD family transcriptional regulator